MCLLHQGKDSPGGAIPAAFHPLRGDQRGAPHFRALCHEGEARAAGDTLERAILIVVVWVQGLFRVLRSGRGN